MLSPGLSLGHPHFDGSTLTAEATALTAAHGRALVDLTAAVRTSPALQALEPQV